MNKLTDINFHKDYSLINNNTYKLDSIVKYYVEVNNIEDLILVLEYIKDKKLDYFILGAGSNVVLDDYFNGVVVRLTGLKNVEIKDKMVVAGAGTMMGVLASETVNNSLTGLEWAINIPGTVGGSIVGNAGAYNSEMFDNLVKIKVLTKDLEIKEIDAKTIKVSYRHTNIKDLGLIVLEGTFLLEIGDKQESLDRIKDRCERRKETQPLDMPSAGSVFRNPEGDFAGRLIEEAGLKGKKIGGAQISLKHANFIVNTGTATSNDIKNLIKLVQREVKEKFGVDLVVEQEILEWKWDNASRKKG